MGYTGLYPINSPLWREIQGSGVPIMIIVIILIINTYNHSIISSSKDNYE